MKRLFESLLFLSRWLLAPFLVVLTLGLLALMVEAGKRSMAMFQLVISGDDHHIALELLNLIDLTLTGALVLIVTMSVYENFVSPVDPKEHVGWPNWMGNIDFSALKLKLLSTIVAISAIKLLEAFMDVSELVKHDEGERELWYYMGIHLVFVISTMVFAISERVAGHGHGRHEESGE